MEKKTSQQYLGIVKLEEEGKVVLDLNGFCTLENVIKKRIIRYTINKVLGNIQGIGAVHIEDIIKMCDKNVGGKYLTPNKKIKVSVNNKKIFFEAI